MRPVKRQEFVEIDVGHAIAPCQHKGAVTHVRSQAFDAPARHGLLPRVDQLNRPVRLIPAVHGDVARAQVDLQVAAERGVVDHEPLDDFTLIAQRNHKFAVPKVGIMAHDVPENRHAADLDHRLGFADRLLRQPRPFSSCQNCDLHPYFLLTCACP